MHKDVPPAISKGFESLLVVIIVSIVFLTLNALIQMTSFGDAHLLILTKAFRRSWR